MIVSCSALLAADGQLQLVHQQRYSMGTMFDIVVYHRSASEARRAIGAAMTEIERLDRVMSHYTTDSDLSRLVKGARGGYVPVDPSLYDVIEQSLAVSRRSRGMFDVTIAPLLGTWKRAQAEGRRPSESELARSARCVGYEKIEMLAPDRIRFTSDCVDLDLGGIGKGYAVDRALGILTSFGIDRALVNAGGSSIAAAGSPPGQRGWPVALGVSDDLRIVLVNESVSTSQQGAIDDGAGAPSGEILDPVRRAPIRSLAIVHVVGRSATTTDALSTALLLLPVDEGKRLLRGFAVSGAAWVSRSGELESTYGDLRFARSSGGTR